MLFAIQLRRRMHGPALLLLSLVSLSCHDDDATKPSGNLPGRKRLLVLTETTNFRHSSIKAAVQTLRELGNETGEWQVVEQATSAAEVAAAITADHLQTVDAVVFANTTGTLSFTPAGRLAFYD